MTASFPTSLLLLLLLTVVFLTASAAPQPTSPTFLPFLNLLISRQRGNRNALSCDGTRVRRDLRDLSSAERADFQSIVRELIDERDSPSITYSEWDILVLRHWFFNSEAHGGDYFLPWHRFFLLLLENTIRNRGRPDFALPYWDWSADASNPSLSTIWNSDHAGGAAPGSAIQTGAFAGIEARFTSPHTVIRNFRSGSSGTLGSFVDAATIDAIVTNIPSFDDFGDATELIHDTPHVAIGGDMINVQESPNDPVFYLHHGFIDYIYQKRIDLFGTAEFSGTHDFGTTVQTVSVDFVFDAFRRSVADSFDLDCVQYQPYSGSAFAGRQLSSVRNGGHHHGAKNSSASEVLKGVCESEKKRLGMTKERCERARNAILKATGEI